MILHRLRQKVVKRDSFWAWTICFSALINNAVVHGIDGSFGEIIGSIIRRCDSNASSASWIASVHSSSMCIFASVSAVLIQTHGISLVILGGVAISCIAYLCAAFSENTILLLLTHGVLGGLGSGLLHTPGQIICTYYFAKHRPIATGLAMAGNGVGIAGVSLLSNYMDMRYGERYVFFAYCLLSPLSLFLGVLNFPPECERKDEDNDNSNTDEKLPLVTKSGHRDDPPETISSMQSAADKVITEDQEVSSPTNTSNSSTLTSPRLSIKNLEPNTTEEPKNVKEACSRSGSLLEKLKLLKDPRLILYCIVHVMFELAFYIPTTFLPEMMHADHGLPKYVEGTIMVVFGVSTLFSKFISGVIAKLLEKNVVLISGIMLFFLGSGSIALTFCSTYEEFIVVTFIYSLCNASVDVYLVYILIELYGISDEFQDAYGLVMLAKMPSPVWGPPLAGAFHDYFGAYKISFYAAGIFQYMAAGSMFLVFVIHYKKKQIQ